MDQPPPVVLATLKDRLRRLLDHAQEARPLQVRFHPLRRRKHRTRFWPPLPVEERLFVLTSSLGLITYLLDRHESLSAREVADLQARVADLELAAGWTGPAGEA